MCSALLKIHTARLPDARNIMPTLLDLPAELQHDNDTTVHEDLEVNHIHGPEDEKYQPLIKTLPPRLEYLCILGYHRDLNEWHDFLLLGLMTDVREGRLLPQLRVTGVWEYAFRPWYDRQAEVYSVESDDKG